MSAAESRFLGLHVLADDGPSWPNDPVEQARAACRAGAEVIQLRAKHATDGVALSWAREIRSETRRSAALFFVNDRFDLALAAEADGVHLGQEDIAPARIPPALRKRLLVGRSTHTLGQAREAAGENLDYVAFGPVFGTTSKASPWAARGTDALADVVKLAAPLPVVAIGGIDANNAARVAAAGTGAAVISAVAGATDPAGATRRLREALGLPPHGTEESP